MASALDAVLALRQSKLDEQQRQSDNLTQGLNSLNQMRQQQFQNQFVQKQYGAGLAEKGLTENGQGGFQIDPNLISPAARLQMTLEGITAGKNLADLGVQTGDASLSQRGHDVVSGLIGSGNQQQPSILNSVQQSQAPNLSSFVPSMQGSQPSQPVPAANSPMIPTTAETNSLGMVTKQGFENPNKSALEEHGKKVLEASDAFNQIDSVAGNLISALKSTYAQQGGSGPVAGMVGNIAKAVGMPQTGNIKGLQNVQTDTALKMAQVVSGGNRAMSNIFSRMLHSIPDGGDTSEQAGSTIAEMYMTADSLQRGMKKQGLTPDDIKQYSAPQIDKLIADGKADYTPEDMKGIYAYLGKRFSAIEPRPSIDLNGKIQGASVNPLSKTIGFKNQSSGYKTGETRKIGNIPYTRQEDGTWVPQS